MASLYCAYIMRCLFSAHVESPPTVSAFGYRLDNVQAMLLKEASFDESSDSESEEEEERWVVLRSNITSSLPHNLSMYQVIVILPYK